MIQKTNFISDERKNKQAAQTNCLNIFNYKKIKSCHWIMKTIAHVCVKLNLGDFTTPFRLTRFADSFYQQKPDFPNDAEMVHLSIVDELPLGLLHCLSSLPPPLSPPSPPPSPSSLPPSLCLVKARRIYIADTERFTSRAIIVY